MTQILSEEYVDTLVQGNDLVLFIEEHDILPGNIGKEGYVQTVRYCSILYKIHKVLSAQPAWAGEDILTSVEQEFMYPF